MGIGRVMKIVEMKYENCRAKLKANLEGKKQIISSVVPRLK